MMDFEDAAVRLARDQSKMRGRRKGGIAISAKARQQAEYLKKQQVRLRAERERNKRNEEYRRQRLHECQRSLKEKSLAVLSDANNSPLFLQPNSIHGYGDKICLPISVLERLASQNFSPNEDNSMPSVGGNPWTFRIGIVNPDYEFPASPLFQVLQAPTNEDDDDDDDDMSENDDEEIFQDQQNTLYLDELCHKYLVYTHCTVLEFTQEEGHVGIPRDIAQALLDPSNRNGANRNGVDVRKTITVDPAASSGNNYVPDDATEQTPGHLAWGAFEIPDVQLEITLLQLPKGIGCTLTPTEEAVKNNFYGLKDVKLVLEQSLIRTRATLSIGDKVSTWFRGTKFDLKVTKVLPSTFQAVTCINTDIEVEIGETKIDEDNLPVESTTTENSSKTTSEKNGFRLGSSQLATNSTQNEAVAPSHGDQAQTLQMSLLPEPPMDQKAGVCIVQIRYSGGHGKRRFAIETAQVKDLFAFAASLINQNEQSFRLVTRFPRRELSLVDVDGSIDSSNSNSQRKKYAELTLHQAGLQHGQEMFIIEGL